MIIVVYSLRASTSEPSGNHWPRKRYRPCAFAGHLPRTTAFLQRSSVVTSADRTGRRLRSVHDRRRWQVQGLVVTWRGRSVFIIIIILFTMNLQINRTPPPPIRQYFRRRRGITWEAYIFQLFIMILYTHIITRPGCFAIIARYYNSIYQYHSIVRFVYIPIHYYTQVVWVYYYNRLL